MLFVPFAGSDPDRYTTAMGEILGRLGLRVTGAHRTADPLGALAGADAVFVGGGNAFRLLREVQRTGLLAAIGGRVRAGMPYLGVSVRFVLAERRGTATYYRVNEACVRCFPSAADIVMGRPVPAAPPC